MVHVQLYVHCINMYYLHVVLIPPVKVYTHTFRLISPNCQDSIIMIIYLLNSIGLLNRGLGSGSIILSVVILMCSSMVKMKRLELIGWPPSH